jgi:hypothetical protein
VATNPFPGYPVSQLDEAGLERRATLETPAIRQTRKLTGQWDSLRGTPAEKPLTVAVRGDYGSGKTHLLLDALATLHAGPAREGSVLRVVGIEAGPLDWYRTTIGPRVAALRLDHLVVDIYAQAAAQVAGAAKLTEGAVAPLESRPESVRTLLRDDLLSRTEVDEQFESQLESLGGDTPSAAIRAFSLLVWFETAEPAGRWLAGEELSEDDATALGLPPSLTTDDQVSDLIVFLGALHAATGRTFAIFVDELEHFARFEAGTGARGNMTWLKRLLQGLAPHNGVTFVAGHWSAWAVEPDVLQRFDAPPIDLLRLTGADVLTLAQSREPNAGKLDEDQGTLIAELCEGNIRKTFWLLRELWTRSSGFSKPLSAEAIKQAAVRTGQRISPETALLRVHEALERMGLAVTAETVLPPGIRFDLVATRSGHPVAIVSVKQAGHEIEGYDELARFLEQLRAVGGDAVGCLLSEGSIEEELRSRVGTPGDGRVVVLDATDPEIATRLGAALSPLLSQGRDQGAAGADEGEIDRLDRERERLAQEVAELKDSHQRDLDEILERVRRQQHETPDSREAALLDTAPSEAYRSPLAVRYEELLARPGLRTQLSYVLQLRSIALLAGAVLGLGAMLFAARSPATFSYDDRVRTIVGIVGAIVVVIAAAMFVKELIQVNRFYDYRDRQLRLVYLRSGNVAELMATYARLQDALDRGGSSWRRVLD